MPSRGKFWDKAVAYLRQAGAKALAGSAHREALDIPPCWHWWPCSISLSAATRRSRPSIFASTCERRFFMLENSGRLRPPARGRNPGCDPERSGQAGARLRLSVGGAERVGRPSPCCRVWLTGSRRRRCFSAFHASTSRRISTWVQPTTASGTIVGPSTSSGKTWRPTREELRGGQGDETSLRSVVSCTWLVWSLAELGAFAEGIAYAQGGIQIAEAVGPPDSLINAYSGIGFCTCAKAIWLRLFLSSSAALGSIRTTRSRSCFLWSPRPWERRMCYPGASPRRCRC